jgi:hypothetical protein
MKDLGSYLTNPFDDRKISMGQLLAFASDHLQRMTANDPGGLFAPRVTATTAALEGVNTAFSDDETKLGLRKGRKLAKNEFRTALPQNVGKIAGVVAGKFGESSPEFAECFPLGRTVFSQCRDDELANHLQSLVTAVTNRQPALGAETITNATGLLTGWKAVYVPSETSTGAKTTTQQAKAAARAALQKELFTNLLTIALNHGSQPAQVEVWMQSSLLGNNHTSTAPAPAPEPTAPVLTRDASGKWSVAYTGPAQEIWQIWARYPENETWADFGEIGSDRLPATDDAMSPDGAWWQVKVRGEDDQNQPTTPFSNVISFGTVPA